MPENTLKLSIGNVALVALVALGLHAPAASAQWKPTRTVEIVAPATPGGGYDTQARTLQRFLQEAKLVTAPTVILNRPGGGGSLGWASLNQSPQEGHAIAVASTTILTNEALGVTPLRHTDITPIAILATEYLVFTVKGDSKLRTGKELVDSLRQSPTALKFATAPGPGNGNHILIGSLARAAGVEVKQVPVVFFKSAAESATALLGGHVDVVVGSIPPIAQFLKNGSLRALALGAPQRHTGIMANVPTWRESGVDAVFLNWRGVVGPKAMTSAQVSYWESILERLSKTPEWMRNVEQDFQIGDYKSSAEAKALLSSQFNEIKASMAQLGLIK